ncbi:Lar family restriction alleviation protein [Enterobacter roggenkampii]|uniref:Lar family restriction alleviation protein n=1 Tax=Enterobacter roggenkampii TaxID=1812935 RepID=UPI0035246C91
MKLLPCPFCGGEPEEYGGMFFEFYGHERQDYSIACKKCRAEVRCDVGEHEGADAPCSCHHDTRKICAEKWNRRAAMLKHSEPFTFIVTSDHRMMEMPQVEAINAVTAMLQGVENAETPTTMQTAPALDSSPKIAELPSGNSPVIPDGWVMVPEDPTHEMLEAGDEQFGTYDVYRRMIEAAPKLE